ncbi:MAG: hypothetical protein K0Q58_1580 [Microbacterium sp.]|jgi:hypothetical protein|nr:hypothetical protein [Microbacterium sp.]
MRTRRVPRLRSRAAGARSRHAVGRAPSGHGLSAGGAADDSLRPLAARPAGCCDRRAGTVVVGRSGLEARGGAGTRLQAVDRSRPVAWPPAAEWSRLVVGRRRAVTNCRLAAPQATVCDRSPRTRRGVATGRRARRPGGSGRRRHAPPCRRPLASVAWRARRRVVTTRRRPDVARSRTVGWRRRRRRSATARRGVGGVLRPTGTPAEVPRSAARPASGRQFARPRRCARGVSCHRSTPTHPPRTRRPRQR